MVNLETGKSSVFLERPAAGLFQFAWSPDGRWIVFGSGGVWVAPFTGDQGPGESAWIPITDGSTSEGTLDWSPDGAWIYAVSNRDGFYCVWAYPLDPLTKRPAGKPQAVFHSHGVRQSLRNANWVSLEISVARDKIVFNQGEVTGNIWMTSFNPD